MTKHMLTSAVFAGFVAGLLAALLQFAFLEKPILLAEKYESRELVHFQGVAVAAVTDMSMPAKPAPDAAAPTSQLQTGAGETSPVMRYLLSVLFAALIYTSYGLVMVAGFALANQFGRRVALQQGLLWGLAGFAAFQMVPALGMAPELPGILAAPLGARQFWWAASAVATVAGLGLLGYGRGLVPWGAALVLLVLPHVIGAPELDGYSGIVPPELAASFAARSLGVGLIAWVTLGGLLAWFWNREPV